MKKRAAYKVGNLTIPTALTVAVVIVLWAVIAYAAAAVQTYSDGTYTVVKTKFGRGVDNVYSRMTGGFNTNTYYAEYWGPSTDGGTDTVFKSRSGALTADGAGVCTTSLVTDVADNSGFWQTRFLHNPQYARGQRVVIDSPAVGANLTAGVPTTLRFHIEDRDGNVITTDNTANISLLLKDGSTVVWRNKAPNPGKAKGPNWAPGWRFTSGYWEYEELNGTLQYTPLANGVLQLSLTLNNGIEPNDTYDMGDIVCNRYWMTGPGTDSFPYALVSASALNPKVVGNPAGTTYSYTYYFDLKNYVGTDITSGTFTWTRTAAEAMDYDQDTLQTTVTGTTPVYDSVAGHWKSTFTLNAPGKYLFKVIASATNAPECDDVVHFAASKQWEMAGDVMPPAEVTWDAPVPQDNVIGMSWTNPVDPDFTGMLILYNTAPISGAPQQGQVYPVGNTGTGSEVVYNGLGTSYTDGDPCIPINRLANGQTQYYKAFTYDDTLNYSAGSQISAVPVDNVKPGEVTGVSITEGDKENTVNWTNPVNCDMAGVTIRYRTDGTFPSKMDGSDGSILAGNKVGGTPGANDSFLHTSLTNGTPYYYTIWVNDDDGNWNNDIGGGAPEAKSPASYAVPHDVTLPAQIDTLGIKAGTVTAFDVILEWNATGDDGATGQATKYDIRFYDQPITALNWDQAWHAVGENPPQPVPAGGLQQYMVAGLSPLTQYYFAIKASDEVPNWSPVSNSPTATTLCNEELDACNQCHLLPPDDDLPGAHPRGSGNIGSHDLPIHASADYNQCNVCHADGNVFRNNTLIYGFNHQNDVIDINAPGKIGNKAERDSSTGGTFLMQTTVVYKYKNYSSGVGYKQMTGYCSNTYCHGAGLSSPRWGLDKIVCGEYCHETPPATGRHVKHYHPGQHYINLGPTGTQISGYTNDDGLSGWIGVVSTNDRGVGAGGNADGRYRTALLSANAQKEFILPDGTWYITVCVGDPSGPLTGQHVEISGDGGSTWNTLINSFDTTSQKLFKKVVDQEFIVVGGQNLTLKVGDGTNLTRLNFMIVNATPEAPKSNVTLLQNTPSEYGFACGKCHVKDAAQAVHTEHVAGAYQENYRDAEIAFDGNSFPKNPLGVFTTLGFANISSKLDGQGYWYTTGNSCVNTYCHGSTLNAGGSNTNPQWRDAFVDVEGASLCGACHEAGYADTTPGSNMSTGSHSKHVDAAYPYRLDCFKCHYHTVGAKDPGNGDKIPIVDRTHHVNGDVDAVFDPNDNTMKFGRYSTAITTCFEVYCHSNGLLTPAGEPAPYTRYREPVWNSGAKTCNYCHGTQNAEGMPQYFNTVTTPNSHVRHVDDNNQGCSTCHYNTTRDDGLTIYTTFQPTLHVNSQGDVSFTALNASGVYNNGNMQCTTTYCHGTGATPTWGGTATCGSCHGDGVLIPNPGVGAHSMHNNGNYDNISTINANASTNTNYDYDCRFCHFIRTHGSGPDNPGVQVAEVNFNTIDVTNGYNNTGATYIPGGSVNLDSNNWEYTNGNCANLLCHSDGKGGPPNNTTYTWTDAPGSLGCNGCHNAGATAPVGQKMDSHAHGRHVWSDVYRKSCQDCHEPTATGSNTITDRSKHVNGMPDVGLSIVWGGSYNSADGTCSGNDCHSNADPSAWNGAGSKYTAMMNWTSSAAILCTTCHSDSYYPAGDGARTADQTLSFNHKKHVNSTANGGYGARYGCTICHNTVALDNSTIKSTVPTMHNNQQKDLVYNTDFFYNMTGPNTANPLSGYWGTWNSPTTGNCTVICHSKPSPIVGNNNITSITNPVRFPNWSSVNYGCNSCHGDKDTLTSGSHAAHTAGANINCGACHTLTAKNDGASPWTGGQQEINATGYTTYHVNLTKEVGIDASVGGSWNSGAKTCTTTDSACHDAGSPVWGTVAVCSDCHQVTGSETDDFTYGNATKATVNFYQYTSVGHGKVGTYKYTGNIGAANSSQGGRQITGCTDQCHATASTHGNAVDPFRLQNTDTNALCAGCHLATQADHHNQVNTAGNGDWSFTPKCVDCHDPHGDDSQTAGRRNYAMIQGFVNYTTASSAYGVPTITKAVSFPANPALPATTLDRESYVQSDYSGLCQICHTGGGNPANFSKDQYVTSHSGTSACTDCHTHASGFKGAGECKTCHGTGGAGTAAGRENIESAFGKNSHHINATWANITNAICSRCHAEANTDGTINGTYHQNTAVDLNVYGTYPTVGSTVAYTKGVSATSVLNSHCLSCHNNTNSAAQPFSAVGDTGTPSTYDVASGGASAGTIDVRYNAAGTTPFSKYAPTNYNVVPQINKAFSPHGNAANNQRGVALTTAWADDGGNTNVACYDCHNSHGSNAGSGGTSTSYSSSVGGTGAGILKETATYTPAAGSGSPVSWAASSDLCWDCHLGDDVNAPKTYTDFGNSAAIAGYYDPGRWQATDSWQPSHTYKTSGAGNGAGSQKGGHFGKSPAAMQTTPANQITGRCTACHDPHGVNTAKTDSAYMVPALKGTWMTSPYKEDRAPAGTTVLAAPTANTYEYRWMTTKGFRSPRFNPRFDYNSPPIVGAGYGTGVASTTWGKGGTGGYGYFIDDNTFGTDVTYATGATITDQNMRSGWYPSTASVTANSITETETQFAGLCSTCHFANAGAKTALIDVTSNNGATSVEAHKAVKGWGAAGTTGASDIFDRTFAANHMMEWYTTSTSSSDMRCTVTSSTVSYVLPSGYRWSVDPGTEVSRSSSMGTNPPGSGGQQTAGFVQTNFHNFPCSKCHTAHTSKLPRLMKTNCIDVSTSTVNPGHANGGTGEGTLAYPNCATGSGTIITSRLYTMTCHNTRKSNTTGGGGWNTITGW